MKYFGIIGHPISHSLSPKMFATAFSVKKINANYEALDILPEKLKDFIQEERIANKFSGLSITFPHKESVIQYLDELSDEAKKIGAVNTLIKVSDRLRGENTGWIGVKYALKGIENIKRKSFLIIGAGGAARAAVFALKNIGVNKIFIWNRTPEKGIKLSKYFDISFAKEIPDNSDIIINCTSLGFKKEDVVPISDEILKNCGVVFDMVYGDTDIILRAQKLGLKTIDGREMLLGQAFEQFKLFTGIDAPKEEMIKAVYNKAE